MRKKIDPELRARAVRLVREHQGQYANITAAVTAVAKQLDVSSSSLARPGRGRFGGPVWCNQ